MNKNVVVIYESIYNGNTEKLAKTMAQKLGCSFIKPQQAHTQDLSQYKAIGFGSGIYFGCHHPAIIDVVAKLDNSTQDVFIFSSRGAPILGKYHKKLKDELTKKGKNIVGEFSVRGYDETGPWVIIGGGNVGKPNEKDLKRAEKFLQNKMQKYCMPNFYKMVNPKLPITEGQINSYSVVYNENAILLKGDLVTINQSACIGCGKCIKTCPLGVIELINGKAVPTKELDCTLCRLCINNCTARAISLQYNWRNAIKVAVRHGSKTTL